MPHTHGLQVLAGVRWRIVREELEDGVVHREQPLGYCQADAGRGEALAQRVERVRVLGSLGRPPPLGGYVPVSKEHETLDRIQWMGVLLDCLDEVQDRRGGDALSFRAAALQLSYVCHDIDLSLSFMWS